MAQTSAIFCSFGNCKRGESNPRVGEDKRDHSRWKKKAEDALIRYGFFYRSTYWFPKPILKRMLIQNSRLMRSMRSRSRRKKFRNCCFLKWFIVKVKAPRDMIAPFGPKASKGLLRWEFSLPSFLKLFLRVCLLGQSENMSEKFGNFDNRVVTDHDSLGQIGWYQKFACPIMPFG